MATNTTGTTGGISLLCCQPLLCHLFLCPAWLLPLMRVLLLALHDYQTRRIKSVI